MGPALIAEIAEAEVIPKKFLDVILLELKNAGLLQSKKGKGGGYVLARPATTISVGAVVRALEGPLALVPCASRTAYRPCTDCKGEDGCDTRWLMLRVRDATAAILDHTTLSDLILRHSRFKHIPMYDI